MADILRRTALSVAFIDERNDEPPYLLIVFDGEDAIRLYLSRNSALNMLTEIAEYAKRVSCKCLPGNLSELGNRSSVREQRTMAGVAIEGLDAAEPR